MLCTLVSEGATRRWDAGGGACRLWTNCTNFTSDCAPGGGDTFNMNCDPGAGTFTINLCGAGNPTVSSINSCNANNTDYVITNGRLSSSGSIRLKNTCVTVRNGGHLRTTSTGCFELGRCANENATLTVDGAGGSSTISTSNSGSRFRLGNGANSSATVNIQNGAYATFNGSVLGAASCSSNTWINVTGGSTLQTDTGSEISPAFNGDGTLFVCNSTVVSGLDLDLGTTTCGKGNMIANCSTINIAEDFIIGRTSGCGGTGTARISGGTMCIGHGLTIGQGGDANGYVFFTNCAVITVNGTACVNSPQGTQVGQVSGCGLRNELHVDSGANLIINDPCGMITGCNSLIEVDGGTISTANCALLTFNCGSVMRADGCHGDGTVGLDIHIRGGTFNDGTSTGDVLVLTGNITQQANTDDMVINGSGTIKLGASDIIDNSNTNLDIDLNGGVLDTGGFTQGSAAATIGNLTLSTGSTIELGSGSHALYLKDFSFAGTIGINGWAGTGGGVGTAGRLLVDSSNIGLGTDIGGINWGGGFGSTYDVIDSGIAGFYEIVPSAAAVPEASTWIGCACVCMVAVWNTLKRFMRRRSI